MSFEQFPPKGNSATDPLKVDGSAVTQPVSGTVTSNIGTTNGLALDGTDGTSPPSVLGSGTGIRGWLRSIYEKLTGTVAVTQSGTWTVQPGNTANTTAWKVDGSAVTQPVSGTVTAAQATAASLKAQVQGEAATGTAKAGNPVQTGAVFTTAQPTVTTGQVVEAQATARGGLIVATGVDTFNTTINTALPTGANAIGKLAANDAVDIGDVTVNNASGASAVNVQDGGNSLTVDSTQLPAALAAGGGIKIEGVASGVAVPVSGTVTATQATGTNLHAVIDTGSTTAVTQATAANLNAQVVGAAASGAAKAGNPVQTGAVFTTAQPTVTTGQVVEAQATARGGHIVATGVDTFNVTVNAALPTGNNVLGHVIADTGSTTAVTGNVTVVQPTGTNLHAVIDSGSTTAVTQATAANLKGQVQGEAASGAAKAGNPIQMGGIFNTTQPTVTTGQAVEAQSSARGAQIVSTGVDTFNATINAALPTGNNVIGHIIADTGSTTAVTGTVTVGQATGTNLHAVIDSGSTTAVTQATGTNLHAVIDSGSTTAVTQATAANLKGQVQGEAASGAAKAGNPVQTGAVFTTAQPTVTTGQVVEAQATARGGLIVATGADTFNVTVNAALPAGTAAIGKLAANDAVDIGDVTVNNAAASPVPSAITDTSNVLVKPGDATNNAMRVNIVAGSSSGTQYVEDAALGATPTGTLSMARRTDTLATLTPVVDDAISMRVNNRGALWMKPDGVVSVDDNAGSLTIDSTQLPAALAAGGGLKIEGVASGVAVPVSGTVTANVGTGTLATNGTATTGAITAVGTVTSAVAGYSSVSVSVNGTYTGLNFTFQVSDDGGTTYYNTPAMRSDNTFQESSYSGLASTSRAWTANVAGFTHFRVNITAIASGTANWRIIPTPMVMPQRGITSIVGNQLLTPIDSLGIATGAATALAVAAATYQTGTTSTDITTAAQTATQQTNGLNAVMFSVRNNVAYTGFTAVFEASNDAGTSYNTVFATNVTTGVVEAGPVTLANTTAAWVVSAPGSTQIRMRCTAIASGTVRVIGASVNTPIAANITSKGQVQGEAASGATKAGNPVQMGGVFNTTQPTVTTGQAVEAQASARGGLIVATGVDVFNTTINAALPTGSNVIGQLTANQSVNTAQIAGIATATGNGVVGTGVQRVAIASDNTAFAVDTELPAAATVLDGAGNPSLPFIAAYGIKYNGSTWDRDRGNWTIATGDTGAKTATFNGATQTNYGARGAWITILLGTVTGTTPTLAAQLQWSPDAGTTWLNFGPALANLTTTSQTGSMIVYPSNISQAAGGTPANLTTGATVSMAINAALPRTWRINYTIGGTSPSFAITSVQVNYTV